MVYELVFISILSLTLSVLHNVLIALNKFSSCVLGCRPFPLSESRNEIICRTWHSVGTIEGQTLLDKMRGKKCLRQHRVSIPLLLYFFSRSISLYFVIISRYHSLSLSLPLSLPLYFFAFRWGPHAPSQVLRHCLQRLL